MKRDPRVDPRPGDVVRAWSDTIRVEIVAGGKVWFRLHTSASNSAPGWCRIKTWRDDCADAEVVEVAE